MTIAGDKKLPPEAKNKELASLAKAFLEAYASSAQSGKGDPTSLGQGRPFSLGAAGIIALTDEITRAQIGFVQRAAKLLKSKAAREKAISRMCYDFARHRRWDVPFS